MLAAAQPLRVLSNRFSKLKPPPPRQPFSSVSSSLLSLCATPELLHQVHSRFIIHGLHQNPTLSSDLIARYAALGRLDLSLKLFASIHRPDALLSTTILRSLSTQPDDTLATYRQMLSRSVRPDETAYPFILRACPGLPTGTQIHCHVVKLGFDLFSLVGNALVEMYVRHREISDARQVFEVMPARDLVSWSVIISGECEIGDPKESFRLFERMRLDGFEPDSHTIVGLLRACVDLNSLVGGRTVHALIVVNDLGGDQSVGTALLTMYCKLDCLVSARVVFDRMQGRDCAVWNIMISGYSRHRYPEQALELFASMVESGVRTDMFTAIALLTSVSQLKSLMHGRQIHGHVIRNGSDCQASVHNSLIEMYCNCKSPEMARKIFDLLTMKTVVPWSCMIKGYITNDRPYESFLLFGEMRMDGVAPDPITLMNVLPACVNLGASEQVKNIHGYSIKQGLYSTLSVSTALLDSYSKCGCLEMARKLFDEQINQRDVVLWNSMIGAYSKHGNWCQSFELYNQMKDSGVRPDQVTFLGLLTACVNTGLLKEGWDCFTQMVEIYGFRPEQEHYACMVDLLGRSGQLDQAKNIIEKMPFKPDVRVWGPLLSACKLYSETSFAELASEKLIQMEPKNAGNYVLLSNIYAAAGKWDGVAKMRSFLRGKGLKKTPGYSWLEVNGHVHKFLVMDQSHPESKDIYAMLKVMEEEIRSDVELLQGHKHDSRLLVEQLSQNHKRTKQDHSRLIGGTTRL